VGKPWSEPLEVRVEEPGSARKDRVNVVLAVGFLVLLYLIAGYAMKTGDGSLVRDVLKITASGLIFAAVWAGGRAALKVLSGFREPRS